MITSFLTIWFQHTVPFVDTILILGQAPTCCSSKDAQLAQAYFVASRLNFSKSRRKKQQEAVLSLVLMSQEMYAFLCIAFNFLFHYHLLWHIFFLIIGKFS